MRLFERCSLRAAWRVGSKSGPRRSGYFSETGEPSNVWDTGSAASWKTRTSLSNDNGFHPGPFSQHISDGKEFFLCWSSHRFSR